MIMFSFGTECNIIEPRDILSKCLIFSVYKCPYCWTQFPTSLVLMIPMHMLALMLVLGPFSRGHKRCYASGHAYAYVGPVLFTCCYASGHTYAYVGPVFTCCYASGHAYAYVGPVFTRCYASGHAYAYVGPVFTRCYASGRAYAYVGPVFTRHKRCYDCLCLWFCRVCIHWTQALICLH